MYNEVKMNMLDPDCGCEYAISEDNGSGELRIYLLLYIGYGMETYALKAWKNGTSIEEGWSLPEYVETERGGWVKTYLSYSDFQKVGENELVVSVFINDVELEKRLVFFHDGLQSSGAWVLTKNHTFGGVETFTVNQSGVSSGGGSGGGGSSGGGETYTAGDGIDISEDNVISANIDGTTITLDENKKLKSNGVTIENAVIVQQKDAAYLLHEYTQTEYIAGNKIGYGGPNNPIILQGVTCYANGGKAPNGIKVEEVSAKTPDAFPDIPVYGSMLFQNMGVLKTSPNYYCAGFHVELEEMGTTTSKYRLGFKTATEDGGASTTSYGSSVSVVDNDCGVTFVYNKIYPPGTYEASTISKYFPYGYAVGRIFYKRKINSVNNTYSSEIGDKDCALPFISEAEYNAAVMLTNESLSLINVSDTTTEV